MHEKVQITVIVMLESRHKGSNPLSIRSPVVDDRGQCFVSVSASLGDRRPVKTACAIYPQTFCFGTSEWRKLRGTG